MKQKKQNGSWTAVAIGLLLLYMLLSSLKSSPKGKERKALAITDEQYDIITKLQAAGVDLDTAINWSIVSKMETGGFTSSLFKNYNNGFGMKHPVKRKTTSIGPTKSGFASYKNFDDSIQDMILYMDEFNYPLKFNSLEDQVLFMKDKGYFEEPVSQYYGLLKAWEER